MKKREIDAKITQIKASQSIQNSINNVSIEVNLSELDGLAKISPELAKEYLGVIKSNQEHVQKVENKLLELEKREQDKRIASAPSEQAYLRRGQIFGFVVMVVSLCVLAFAIYCGETGFAITSAVGVLLLSLYHISGKKEQSSITANTDLTTKP